MFSPFYSIRVAIFGFCSAVILVSTSSLSAEEATSATAVPAKLVVVRLTPDVFASALDKAVDLETQVDDVILGARVLGHAHTTGKPLVEFMEDPRTAGFHVVLHGTTASRTTGHKGPVTVRSRSETRFTATKQVLFDPEKGFYALPTRVNARTRTVTDGIATRRNGPIGRLIRRKAAEQVEENKPLTTEIARQKAERRIAELFDQRMEPQIARLNQSLQFRESLLVLRGSDEESIYSCCSTRDYMQIVVAGQRCEPQSIELPALTVKGAPVQIWVHESVVSSELAGKLMKLSPGRTGLASIFPWPTISTAATTSADNATTARPAETGSTDAISSLLPQKLASSDVLDRVEIDFAPVDDWFVVQITEKSPDRIATLAR